MTEDLELGDCPETCKKFFEASTRFPPQSTSSVTLVDVENFLRKMERYTRLEEQQAELEKLLSRFVVVVLLGDELIMIVVVVAHLWCFFFFVFFFTSSVIFTPSSFLTTFHLSHTKVHGRGHPLPHPRAQARPPPLRWPEAHPHSAEPKSV
jgi:hypothetical protein